MYNGEKSSNWKHLQFNVFMHVFNNILSKKTRFLCFYLQINVFNIYGTDGQTPKL